MRRLKRMALVQARVLALVRTPLLALVRTPVLALVQTLVLFTAAPVFAAGAPALSPKIARSTNDLQRAVWACENGAPSLTQKTQTVAGDHQRFFLESVDGSANKRNVPPLVLRDTQLKGLGRVSNNFGWFTIRFECALAPGLDRATAFTFEALAPIPPNNSKPPAAATHAPGAEKRNWYVEGSAPAYLVHGIAETDDRDFRASCTKGAAPIKVELMNTVPGMKPGNYITVSLSNGADSGLYVARGVMDENLGAAMPVFAVGATDPLLAWIGKGASLVINIGGEVAYDISLKGGAPAAEAFAKVCGR